jgi:hypothetical protein
MVLQLTGNVTHLLAAVLVLRWSLFPDTITARVLGPSLMQKSRFKVERGSRPWLTCLSWDNPKPSFGEW